MSTLRRTSSSGCRSLAALLAACLASLAARGTAHAQSATLAMTADRTTIALGDTLRLQVQIDVSGVMSVPEPSLPDLSRFQVMSHSTQMSLGGRGASVAHVFLLRGAQEGTFELTPARVVIGGRQYVSNPLTIRVVGSATGTGTPPPDPRTPPQTPPTADPPVGQLDGAVYDDLAFVRTVVDRQEAWVGEQVTVTIYLYMRGSLRAMPQITREATTDGFWVHDLLGPSRSMDPTVQVVGSTPFRVYVLRRFAAFPLREGELTIGETELHIQNSSPIDLLLGGGGQPDLTRLGVPVTVRVRPLPTEARPPGVVHVGQLALEASIDRPQVPTGDAVTITLRANGTGHVQSVDPGELRVDGLRVLAPQTRDEVASPGDLVSGTRTFEWLVVPEREGTFTIGPFRVPVFDPVSSQYRVIESAPLTLVAAGNPVAGTTTASADTTATPDARDASETATFGPVRTESALARRVTPLAAQGWFPWLLALFPTAWVIGTLVRGARRRAQAEGRRATPQRISRDAKKRLAAAEEKAREGDARAFYAAVIASLKAVIEGRLGEAVGSLTHAQLRRRLIERGMSDALAQRVVEELEGAEMVRFSAAGGKPEEMAAALGRARELIGELDRFVASAPEDA